MPNFNERTMEQICYEIDNTSLLYSIIKFYFFQREIEVQWHKILDNTDYINNVTSLKRVYISIQS